MTFAFILLLLSGFTHAVWNFLTKKSENKLTFLWVANLGSLLLFMPFFVYEVATKPLPSEAIVFMLISLCFHMGYGYFLGRSHMAGDFSHVYPIMRGTGALCIPLIGVFFLNQQLTLTGWIGLSIVLAGILVLGNWQSFHSANVKLSTLLLAVTTGVIISGYTIFDNLTLAYLTPLAVVQVGHFGYFISLGWDSIRSKKISTEWAINKWNLVIGALLMPGSYLIFLFALRFSSVSQLGPMREIGIVFATLMGIFLLKETSGYQRRIIASILITIGVIVIKSM
jgi:drug/metabolite transporter (DMT)-like permease